MKCIKRILPALLVSVMATTAHAGDGGFSLFHCGLQWGGTAKSFGPDSAAKKSRQYKPGKQPRSIVANGASVTTFTDVKTKDIGRLRMPPKVTFAKIGCSWR